MQHRYYYPPPRRAGLHRRSAVPVGRSPFGQATGGGLDWGSKMIECLSIGGVFTPDGQCLNPTGGGGGNGGGGNVGTGFPPGTVPTACGPQQPCPAGMECHPTPAQIAPFLPGVSSICMPTGAQVPPGTGVPPTTQPPPPSMPPPTTQPPPPTQPPPGLPPAEKDKKAIFGLPPVAVYIGFGALGLLAIAAIAGGGKKKRRR